VNRFQDEFRETRLARALKAALVPAMALLGASQACAETLPSGSGEEQGTTLEAPGSHAIQLRVALRSSQPVAADRFSATVQVSHDQMSNVAKVTSDHPQTQARVTLGGVPAGAQVTVSRTADIVGRPVDIFHPRPNGQDLSASIPSGMPVAARSVTSGFGMRVHPILGGWRPHSGVDLAAAYGSPVVATSDGVVGEADWRGGYGLFVTVDKGGLETRYGHLSRLNVGAGQRVRKGDVIGFVGSTGRSTGPHLHYEVRINGRAVNPLRQKAK